MPPANDEVIEAPEQPALLPTTSPRDPEKQSLKAQGDISRPNKMLRIQYFFFTLLILTTLLGLTIVSATSHQGNGAVSEAINQEKLRFLELLDSVEPSSLHAVLHQHMKEKYRHGVYQEDKHAMEVVHQENAEVAHSLIELAKRQAGNGTTTTTETTTTETQTQTQTENAPPPPTTSDDPPPPSSAPPSSPPASPTQGSSTDDPPKQTSSTSSDPSTPSTPSTTPSSPTIPPSSSNGKSSSTLSKATTSATPSRSVTQEIVYTSTKSNGDVVTSTSIIVVPADQAQTAGGSSATNTGTASLQSNSGRYGKTLSLNGILGALGLVMVAGGL